MKLKFAIVALVVLFSGSALAEVIYNEQEPWFGYAWIPCANDGDGEGVLLEGRLHVMFREEMDAAGGWHWGQHFQPMGVSGYGDVTGDRYQATGGTFAMENGRFPGCPYEFSYVNNYKIIGQGRNNNYLVHENYHIAIDPDCNVTIERDNFSVECR